MYREESIYRNEDERLMQLVSDFLDKYLYSRIASEVVRYEDKATQTKGIDLTFKLNSTGKEYKCDEKAAVRYINKGLRTFSLELSFINRRNEVQTGWLISHDDSGNDSYMFIWIDDAESEHPKTIEEIHGLEVALVRKTAIMDYLKSLGWDKEKLLEKDDRIRMFDDEYMGNINRNGFKFSFSQQLVEQPINILLTRDVYKQISDYTEYIKQ